MNCIAFMLGNGLLKKEKKITVSKRNEKVSQKIRKKISVELFLREILGTHLIEKKL